MTRVGRHGGRWTGPIATPDEPRIEYSLEQIGLLDPADLIVVFDYGDGTTPSQSREQPLFARLPAVQAGRVIVVSQGERDRA